MANNNFSEAISAIVVFVFVMIVWAIFGGEDDPAEEAEKKAASLQQDCEDSGLAFLMSHTFVERSLTSPKTAEFPSRTAGGVALTYLGECRHQIAAYVDAQNGFGALVRQKYSAELRFNKDEESWTLIELDFN